MKVLHILNTGKYSGAENVVITLINALKGKVDCAYTSPDGPINEILQEESVNFFPMDSKRANVKEIKRIISLFKPDLIHAHDYNAGVMATLSFTRIPIINHLHNNTPWMNRVCIKSIIYRCSCLRYKKVLGVSDSVIKEYVFGNSIVSKFFMVGNPINIQDIVDKTNSVNSDLGFDVIFLGRLSEQKQPLFFVDIVAEIVAKYGNLKASMVGTGELRSQVELKIKKLGLENNIILYGFQKNPYVILKKSKVLCMPSKWEGFGIAAVEGLAFGIPVVAAPVGGLVGIVNSKCGLLCKNKREYVDEICKLLQNQYYYEEKSKAAFIRAGELNNIGEYANKIISIYTTTIEEK